MARDFKNIWHFVRDPRELRRLCCGTCSSGLTHLRKITSFGQLGMACRGPLFGSACSAALFSHFCPWKRFLPLVLDDVGQAGVGIGAESSLGICYAFHRETLCPRCILADLYAALRKRAKQNRTSIASEVISLLQQSVPTAADQKRRKEFLDYVLRLKETSPPASGPFPSAEEMIR